MSSKTFIIKPAKGLNWQDLKELWCYRELFYFLTWRDIKIRYKQTAIGVFWAILQPLLTMVVFSVFFGKLAKMPSDNVPYPIFVYSGLLFWQFFSGAVTDASRSLTNNASLLSKIYFPRLILPISVVATKFVDFFIASLMLIVLMIYYNYLPDLAILFILPLLLVIIFMNSAGLGLLLAFINVKYRDVRYALPFFIQTMLFVTPVIYSPSLAGSYAWIFNINPLAGIINVARASLFSRSIIDWQSLVVGFLISAILFFLGVITFKKTEPYFADII